ncbi:MAG TPA: hypothetical protein VKY74_07975 [Chloroflexia bacterium]|nr:hypothetical protein [Chloroflexia bacterium]
MRTAPALILLALLGAGGWAAPPGRAAPPAQLAGLTMTVQAGYEGHYKLGEWFPVQVTLSNIGQAFDAEVQVTATGPADQPLATYARPVTLPSPARKVVTLYTYATAYQHQLTVHLLRGNTEVLQQQVRIDPLNDAFLLGVVSDSPDLLNFLANAALGAGANAGNATIAHLAPGDLPSSAPALGGLDALVFAGTDTSSLSADQRQAIAGWVVAGGTLVVAGGSNSAAAAGLADLLPVTLAGSYPLTSLAPLATFAGGTAPPANGVLASDLQLRPETGARVLVDAAGHPLLVRRTLGAGEVFALALDPSVPPLKIWDGGADFWKQVFATHLVSQSAGAARRTGNLYNQASSSSLGGSSSYYLGQLSPFDLPALQLPGVGLVGGFLFLYVLVLGPINYLLLRRWGRSDLAWITIPGLILLFAALAYLVGYNSKGSQLRLTTATVVHTYPAAPIATVDSFVGLFSPNREAYNLQFAADTQLSEVDSNGLGGSTSAGSPVVIDQGKPSGIGQLQIDTWSLRGFQAETTIPYQAPFDVQLQSNGSTIRGQITNHGSTLQDVAVIAGDQVQVLGTLAAGRQAAVQVSGSGMSPPSMDQVLPKLIPGLQLQTWPPPNSATDRAGRRRAALIDAGLSNPPRLAAPASAWVIGWSPTIPLDIQVAGQQPVRDDLVLIAGQFPVEQLPGPASVAPLARMRPILKRQP